MERELFERLIGAARFSPTVHNVQPTRWRLEADGSVLVLQAPGRTLPVGDPSGRDVAASHGSAVEGFTLAAGREGWAVAVEPANGAVARLRLTPGGAADPLAAGLESRRTYRGKFEPAPAAALEALAVEPDLQLVTGAADIGWIAALADAASLRTFRDRAFRAELVGWMRLSRRDPNWARDGLNAQAMAMSPVEAVGAGLVLRPGAFEALDAVRLAGPLTGDAAVTRSASAVALFRRPSDEPPFETGRRWHRAWLAMEAVGLSAAPLTVLGDDPAAERAIAERFGRPPGTRLVTAFRVGVAPAGKRPAPARLPLAELIA